jgi:hypothetical protein
MTDRFGDVALRRCALAARHLGWRPTEFWAATPAEMATALAQPEDARPLARDDIARMMEHDDGAQ